MINKDKVASMIDHTILKAVATPNEVEKLCKEAIEFKFASVCINPCHIPLAADILKGSGVKVCTVIGFPLGANTTEVKALETKNAVELGAEEVDMVINIGMLKAKEYDYVLNDIQKVVEAAKNKAIVKVIIETCYLTDEEKVKACELSKEANADFVKTSTGFGTSGAKTEDVNLMRQTVGDALGVKASGGIHSYEDALSMIEKGANRLGTSSSIKIVE